MSVAQMPESIQAFVAGFQFVRPWWLLALLLVPVLPWWLHRQRRRRNAWREAVDAHLLRHLIEGGDAGEGGRLARGHVLATLALILAVLALAGPSWRSLPQPLWQDRTPLVIAVDLSEASTAADLPPSRLLQMRAKLTRLLRERGGGQIALVAFADDAYIVSPLTDDAANIELFVDALSPDVMPDDGQRAERAIRESVLLLERAGFPRGDILLMTHRADASARRAAGEARTAGFRVSVLGLGTAEGGSYVDRRGRRQRTALDVDGLRATADAGDGRFVPASVDDSDLRALGVLRADRVEDAVADERRRGALAIDEGFWLLPPLLLLALFAFRRGVLAVALLALCLPWQVVHADDGTLWQRRDQAQHARLQRGVEAYRSGDYKAAMSHWADLPGADAAYNRGNALARQGRYDEAIAEYDRALRLQPGMADAIENRRVASAARQQQAQRKPQPGSKDQAGEDKDQQGKDQQGKDQQGKDQQGKDQQGKDQQGKDQQGKDQQGKDQQGKDQQGKDQAGKIGQEGQRQAGTPPPSPGTGMPRTPAQAGQKMPAPTPAQSTTRPSGPATPADIAAQRQADAAQRERMRRAQGASPSTTPPAGAPSPGTVPSGQAAPGGRRLANEAWLRRVPDDPGGLLREKFKLEERRRRREDDR
ncbi:tetratricopeptide repeat protein [Lysobacter brunescens]|uniref:Tetratricopeptide repeat protein n=1 Tax=Lysobacter brunescens TaxID=262323 RepID=A0ABW2YKQ4_9GAMM